MATKKEVLQEKQAQIFDKIEFLRLAMIQIKSEELRKMYQGKIDELLDAYNHIQKQIDKL